jgi:hypothetical protein
MKHRIANILKRLWEPVIGAAGIVPLGCLLFARFVPVLLPLAWVYPILYGIILFVYQQVPGKFRRTVIITGMGLLLAMGIIFLIRHTYFCVMAVPFFTAVLLFIQSMEGGFSIQSYLCAGLHLIWMIVLALNRRTDYFYYESVETGLSVSFLIFLFLSGHPFLKGPLIFRILIEFPAPFQQRRRRLLIVRFRLCHSRRDRHLRHAAPILPRCNFFLP